jgi:hypothetical protein
MYIAHCLKLKYFLFRTSKVNLNKLYHMYRINLFLFCSFLYMNPRFYNKKRFEVHANKHIKIMNFKIYSLTVGAQSIALAQSIAHSHIGTHICEKNEIFEKLVFLQKIKRCQFSSRFLNQKTHF